MAEDVEFIRSLYADEFRVWDRPTLGEVRDDRVVSGREYRTRDEAVAAAAAAAGERTESPAP